MIITRFIIILFMIIFLIKIGVRVRVRIRVGVTFMHPLFMHLYRPLGVRNIFFSTTGHNNFSSYFYFSSTLL